MCIATSGFWSKIILLMLLENKLLSAIPCNDIIACLTNVYNIPELQFWGNNYPAKYKCFKKGNILTPFLGLRCPIKRDNNGVYFIMVVV